MEQVNTLFGNLLNIGIGVAAAVSAFFVMWGAFLYMSAAGSPRQMEAGKTAIVNALGGAHDRAARARDRGHGAGRDGMSPQQEFGRHEIPTHLGVADKAFGGLTMRQLLSAAAGLALAYGAASDLPLPLPARLLAAALVLAATLLLVLWRPAGRPLEEWLFVLGRYHAVPRVAVWRPCERRRRRGRLARSCCARAPNHTRKR